MNGFYVIANQQKGSCRREAEFIRKYLEDHGKKCYIQEQARSAPDSRYRYTDAGAIPPDVEGVLVLGGDGTLIQASRDLAETGLRCSASIWDRSAIWRRLICRMFRLRWTG